MPFEKAPMTLSGDFKYVLDTLEKTKNSMFITGRAGTGKSTLLRLFRSTTRKKTVVLAPTGVAALNAKGQTIHSFFKFPPKPLAKSEIKKVRASKMFKKIEVIVIDEISMVRADLLDNIDYFLRKNRDNPAPFGGVQMVFFGDLFQLPPVVATEEEKKMIEFYYDSPYFFSAHVFDEIDYDKIELRKIYRQEERHFIRLLEAVRLNQVDYDDLSDLNERYNPNFDPEVSYITLTTRNAIVNSINKKELSLLDTKEYTYLGKVSGSFNVKLYPAELALKLKEGSQVMFVKNDPLKQYVNGTIGKITSLTDESIHVSILNDDGTKKTIEVEMETWDITKYHIDNETQKIEQEVVGSFEQYPLRHAWAITIHKSQGKTFDRAIIDLGRGSFEHGQTYVALSRCRTLGGIVLKQKLRQQDILVDERIVEYYEMNF